MATEINLDVARDSTMKEQVAQTEQMVSEMQKTNAFLAAIAQSNITALTSDWKGFARLAGKGAAESIFAPGDQIMIEWKDIVVDKAYTVPLDILHFGTAELENGQIVQGVYVGWHYLTPFGVQFDNYEAFYVAETEELPAGTYSVTIGTNWGNNCVKGTVYNFTLTKPVPVGGQLAGFEKIPDVQASALKVSSYASNSATEPIETVSVSVGEAGTSLGTLEVAGNEQLNSLHRVGYGYNRYGQSAMVQWLNSNKGAGEWWTPQNKYDRPPAELKTKAGFLTGLSEDTLSVIRTIKVTTLLNTVIPADREQGQDITYNKVFLASLEQMFIKPQAPGEGEPFAYWKQVSGQASPMEHHKTYPNMIHYAVENHNSAQTVRLRSVERDGGSNTWCVYTSGRVGGYSAAWTYRCAPVWFVSLIPQS